MFAVWVAACMASQACAAEHTSLPSPELALSSAPAASTDITSNVSIGDPAPTFSYLGIDGCWHDSRALWNNTPALIVFGARDEQLAELDRARPMLEELGIRPVAVVDMRTGSAARYARRLRLQMSLVVDPQCAIAGLYGTLDPVTRRHAPSFFVLDAKGTVRGGGRGPLPSAQRLAEISAISLGQPLPVPASSLN